MIYEGSRYEINPVVFVSTANGERHRAILHNRFFDEWSFDFDHYTVKEGDRLDLLAHQFLGDAELWWMIARANPEIPYPDEVVFGTTIRIPHARSLR